MAAPSALFQLPHDSKVPPSWRAPQPGDLDVKISRGDAKGCTPGSAATEPVAPSAGNGTSILLSGPPSSDTHISQADTGTLRARPSNLGLQKLVPRDLTQVNI